jgi:hypothetical protein
MNDPIHDLVLELEATGKPTLAWIVRWSANGAEPVSAAWKKSRSPRDMLRILEWVGHKDVGAVQSILRAPIFWDSTDVDRVRSEAIRRSVTVPPTLDELLRVCGAIMRFAEIDAFSKRNARKLLSAMTLTRQDVAIGG